MTQSGRNDQLGSPPTIWEEIHGLRSDVDGLKQTVNRWAGVFVGLSIAIQIVQLYLHATGH